MRQQRDLVARHLLGEREGDAGRERREVAGARRALALEALVAFDALVGGVAGLAFLEDDLDAVDAAVALVEERPVVGDAVGERNAVRRIGTGAIDQRRQELLVLRQRRRRRSPPRPTAAAAKAKVLRSCCSSCQFRLTAGALAASVCLLFVDAARRSAPAAPASPLPRTSASIGVRPEPQLLLGGRPKPGKTMRLDDQQIADQRAGDDEHQQRHGLHRDRNAQRMRHLIKQDRQDQDEGRAEERAEDRAEPADDDHEQQLERAVDVEGRAAPRRRGR